MNLALVRNTPIQERVYRATAELLLRRGARQLRTAEIADGAGVPESTLFRSVGRLAEVLEQTDAWAWEQVVGAVSRAAFVHPSSDPREALLNDMEAIWAMRSDPELKVAASYAFLFFRRRSEFGIEASGAQLEFTARLDALAKSLVAATSGHIGDKALGILLMNYVATVWLTWETMPTDRADLIGEHELSADEAQLGVLVLLDRACAQ